MLYKEKSNDKFRIVKTDDYYTLEHTNGEHIMNTSKVLTDDYEDFISKAEGSILLGGLGMGYLVKRLLEKSKVTDITVIEINKDLIDFISSLVDDNKVTIINQDIFTWKCPKEKHYDYAFYAIWKSIFQKGMNNDINNIKNRYKDSISYQEAWRENDFTIQILT